MNTQRLRELTQAVEDAARALREIAEEYDSNTNSAIQSYSNDAENQQSATKVKNAKDALDKAKQDLDDFCNQNLEFRLQ